MKPLWHDDMPTDFHRVNDALDRIEARDTADPAELRQLAGVKRGYRLADDDAPGIDPDVFDLLTD